MKPLHICYVEMGYPHHHGGGGGAGTYVQLVGKELVRRGHEVSVVTAPCFECRSHAVDEGVDVYRPRLPGTLHWYLGRLPGIRIGALAARYLEHGWHLSRFLNHLHRQQSIDLVEYTEGGDFWHALRAPFPYIVHLHGSRYTFLRMSSRPVGRSDLYHRRLELSFIRRAHYVISPSQALLDLVAQELGHELVQSAVLPYPLDPRLMDRRQPAEVGTGADRIVLFAARNDSVKGAETMLQAVPMIRRRFPAVEFHLVGYAPATAARLPDGVLCRPFVAKDELLAYYQCADICVVPSLWDNSPNTVYEAMAAGKAVVASRVGGIPELVVDGETGVLVEPNNPPQLAHAIVRLLRDEDERRAMGRKGRERIHRLADLGDNVGRRVDLYNRMIAEWPPRNTIWNYAHRPR
jgi:glycosyltransferase involved in cell wall biosynthesis